VLESLLPISALREEASGSVFALERVDRLGTAHFLNLTIFLLSNNLPGKSVGKQIFEWLQNNGAFSFLDQLSSIKTPSAEALFENLFHLAIEAEDADTAMHLLKTGINPNGHCCRHRNIPDTMTPLQFACFTGQTALARALIRVGAEIDEPGAGWKSSALVLAIAGYLYATDPRWLRTGDYCELLPLHSDDTSSDRESDILSLVDDLINAGACINPEDLSEPCDDMYDNQLLKDNPSPLTAASKLLLVTVVRRLLGEGADVDFVTDRGTSALHECIYNMWVWGDSCLSHAQESKTLNVVRVLLEFGANKELVADHSVPCNYDPPSYDLLPHYHVNDGSYDEDDEVGSEEYSEEEEDPNLVPPPLDCAIRGGSVLLVEVLLNAGAPSTATSLTRAFQSGQYPIFNLLVKAMMENLSPMSTETAHAVVEKWSYLDGETKCLLLRCQDSKVRQQMAIAAIGFGESSLLNDLLFSENVVLTESFKLSRAVEECCWRGSSTVLCQILDSRFIYRSAVVSSLFAHRDIPASLPFGGHPAFSWGGR